MLWSDSRRLGDFVSRRTHESIIWVRVRTFFTYSSTRSCRVVGCRVGSGNRIFLDIGGNSMRYRKTLYSAVAVGCVVLLTFGQSASAYAVNNPSIMRFLVQSIPLQRGSRCGLWPFCLSPRKGGSSKRRRHVLLLQRGRVADGL